MTAMTLYKFTNLDDTSCNGGSGKWVKGKWRTVRGEIVPCSNGLHLCREQDLLEWLAGLRNTMVNWSKATARWSFAAHVS